MIAAVDHGEITVGEGSDFDPIPRALFGIARIANQALCHVVSRIVSDREMELPKVAPECRHAEPSRSAHAKRSLIHAVC